MTQGFGCVVKKSPCQILGKNIDNKLQSLWFVVSRIKDRGKAGFFGHPKNTLAIVFIFEKLMLLDEAGVRFDLRRHDGFTRKLKINK